MILENCTVIRAYKGTTDYSNKVANRLSVKMPDALLTDYYAAIGEAFKATKSAFIPSWYKEAKGFCNMTSDFDIPVRLMDGTVLKFEQWVESNNIGDIIKVKINIKDGAIYPQAIVVTAIGEHVNPFEGM